MDKKPKTPAKDILGYLLLGISVMMLFKSLMLCFSNDIWYDELFTVGMIEHSYGDLIAFTARDVHPPLYYCIVKFFVDLCKLIWNQASPVAAAKAVSVLPYFILLLYSLTLIRKRFGIFTGGLFLFCVAAMPQLSGYMVEVRMYSFALLFVTAAFLHAHEAVMAEQFTGLAADRQEADKCGGNKFLRAHMRKVHGAALVCYSLAAAYTQYFACVAVVMVYLYALLVFMIRDRGRIKEWFLWTIVCVVGYAPWLYALYTQMTTVKENYWILPLTWRSLGGCVKFLMKPAFTNGTLSVVLAVVLFFVYSAVMVWMAVSLYQGIHRRKGDNEAKLFHNSRENSLQVITSAMFALAGVGVLGGLVLFGFIASILFRPVFVYRYMIPATGCFWLGFAQGVNFLFDRTVDSGRRQVWTRRILPGVITVFLVVIGLRDYRAFLGEEEYKAVLMKQTETALSSIAPQDVVIYNFDQVQAVTSYYLDRETDSYLWGLTAETLIQEIVRPYGSIEETAQIIKWCRDGRNVWFIGSFNSRDEIAAEWTKEGLQVEETGSYLLERYWFNLYKISAAGQ